MQQLIGPQAGSHASGAYDDDWRMTLRWHRLTADVRGRTSGPEGRSGRGLLGDRSERREACAKAPGLPDQEDAERGEGSGVDQPPRGADRGQHCQPCSEPDRDDPDDVRGPEHISIDGQDQPHGVMSDGRIIRPSEPGVGGQGRLLSERAEMADNGALPFSPLTPPEDDADHDRCKRERDAKPEGVETVPAKRESTRGDSRDHGRTDHDHREPPPPAVPLTGWPVPVLSGHVENDRAWLRPGSTAGAPDRWATPPTRGRTGP